MADIYLALTSDQRQVAVKVLNKERSKESEACTMFLQEARVVALLDHPNIAHVLDVDVTPEGHHFLAMEYVHGADLRELLSAASHHGRAMPYDTAIAIVIGAAAGLDYAHRRCTADGKPLRLVHRDVSLSNIMVNHDGGVKVVDFGIASTAIQTVHTSPGIVRGKASYMSPEQCMGDRVDHRTDVFALGVVLYELTTGARCFSGKSDFERMLAVVRGEYIQPRDIIPDFPVEIDQVIRCALAIDAGLRYPSAAALIEALERVLESRGWCGGAAPIVREMRLLFGEVPAPSSMTAAEPLITEEDLAAMPIIPLPPIPTPRRVTATTRASRLARGTETDTPPNPSLVSQLGPLGNPARGSTPSISPPPVVEPGPGKLHAGAIRTFTGWAPAPSIVDDDQPTRGRYIMRRPPTAPGLDR
ncbi:MAG: serine/threonine protein kinase [Deltaproteobacteria bacterium]|nr:serine/threonine protein kinase [Deltaproteobacteria bacterium]